MNKTMKIKEHKNEYWQAVRGVCILAVIMIHCPNGMNYSPVEQNCWLILRQFINFPVALFIFMSGYFVNTNKIKENNCIYLLKRGGGRLLIPYFIWSTVYLVKDLLLNGTVSFKHILSAYCAGRSATPFYYIVVLVQLTLLTPWLVRLKNRRWLYMVTPIYLVALYAVNITTGAVPKLYETVFPAWFGFYILGINCKVGKRDNVVEKVRKWWIAVALFISISESFLLLKLSCAVGFASSQIRFGSFLYAVVIAMVLMKEFGAMKTKNAGCGNRIFKLLVSIGDCSYGIFYVHMLVLMLVQKLAAVTGLTEIWAVNFLLCFVLTAVGSFLIVWFTRKIATKIKIEGILQIIGF